MSDLSYSEVRALISKLSGGENFIGIPRPLIAMVGDHVAALVLNQALYYMERADEEGWVNRSHEEWHADIYVSPYQLRRAFEVLAPFGLETKLKKVGRGPTIHFRIDSETFVKALRAHFKNAPSPIIKKLDNQEASQTLSDPVYEETRQTKNLRNVNEETSLPSNKDKNLNQENNSKSHSADKPPKRSKVAKVSTADPRSKHPAIQIVRTALGHYPKLILYDKVIGFLGEDFDADHVIACATECASRGGNVENLTRWLFDWYENGIPPKGSWSNAEPNGNRNTHRAGKEKLSDHARRTAEYFGLGGKAGGSG